MKIVLDLQEIQMFEDIIDHAVFGFGLGVTDTDYNDNGKMDHSNNLYQIIKNEFRAHLAQRGIDAPREKLIEFLRVYQEAIEKLDPTEMSTITGYEWSDAKALEEKIKSAL
jgi:hypothetical protein